jgi:hypothetical protein
MNNDVRKVIAVVASVEHVRDAVKPLGVDVAKFVAFAEARGYLFTGDDLDELADHWAKKPWSFEKA